jgi:hypothetical protein
MSASILLDPRGGGDAVHDFFIIACKRRRMEQLLDAVVWFKDVLWYTSPAEHWLALAVLCIGLGWVASRTMRR